MPQLMFKVHLCILYADVTAVVWSCTQEPRVLDLQYVSSGSRTINLTKTQTKKQKQQRGEGRPRQTDNADGLDYLLLPLTTRIQMR